MNQPRQLAGSPDPQEQELDTEIASIRAEILSLQRRKRILSSSLLSAPSIRPLLRNPPPTSTITSLQDDLSPLARAADKHSTTNHHRIGFGTTAFPFLDPSPSVSPGTKHLLGIRVDVCTRNGRFAKPYYVLLRRERARGESQKRFRVHRHTVPAFIALSKLQKVFLPFPGLGPKKPSDGDGEGSDDDGETFKVAKGQETRRQDLRAFVRELRRELVSWHLRCDAVDFLREKLGLDGSDDDAPDSSEREHGTGIVSLAPTAIEARYVRLEWEDGRVGRFKLSNTGIVERAVVIGDKGRDQPMEEAMTGGGGKVETLLERLRRRVTES